MKFISKREVKRRVFNAVLMESFSKFHNMCCTGDKILNEKEIPANAKQMSDAFFCDMTGCDKKSIDQTKDTLSEAVTFVKDWIVLAEQIADAKAAVAKEEGLDIPDSQEVELGEHDKVLIDKLFDEKNPKLQADVVRDDTVKALIAEDKKAQEIRDALDIANSQISAGTDPKTVDESVKRLASRGPTSLMNAILNSYSGLAVRKVNEEADDPVSVGTVMSEHADLIKTNAVMMYTLFEATSVLGIHKFSKKEIKEYSDRLYYGKN